MMPADLTSSDSEVLNSPETPQQETPRTCTRQNPCTKPTCYTCASPSDSNHIRNLTTALNTTCYTCVSPSNGNHVRNLTTALNMTCYTCSSPSDGNHVRNLTTELNTTCYTCASSSEGNHIRNLTTGPKPYQPAPGHLIRDIHSMFLDALQENYFAELFYIFQDAIHQDHLEELIYRFKEASQCNKFTLITCVANLGNKYFYMVTSKLLNKNLPIA